MVWINAELESPELGVELNIFRWFKIAGTAGYRQVTGVNEALGQTNEDFSGFNFERIKDEGE